MHEESVTPAEERRVYRFFEISLLLKGANAVLEIAGALLVFLIPPSLIQNVAAYFTDEELGQDPHDFIATHIRHWADIYATGPHQLFIAAYLLSHGVVKFVLVVGLLKNKQWAYPAALVVFALFVLYQLYLLSQHLSPSMAALTLFDFFVIWSIWREYKIVLAHREAVH